MDPRQMMAQQLMAAPQVPEGPPPGAMPPGAPPQGMPPVPPPGGPTSPPSAPGSAMTPDQAQTLLKQLGITPEALPMVKQAIMAMETPPPGPPGMPPM